MGSAFDSEVYAERQRLPGVSIGLTKLLRELMWATDHSDQNERQPVTLSLVYRPDVETSEWYELRWDGQSVSATTLELCLFRAAVLRRRDDERAKKYAGIEEPPTSDPEPPPS